MHNTVENIVLAITIYNRKNIQAPLCSALSNLENLYKPFNMQKNVKFK